VFIFGHWAVLGIYPLHQTEELSSLVALTTIGLGTIMTIICLILALRIARNASSPLAEVVSCLQRITQGDFSARTRIDRTDEFGYLGKSVNSMVEQIETLIATNREKEKNLRTAEIHALQSQIHPHFIFNCLETIKGYILLGQVQDAAETVVELGNLLRSNIDVTEEMISIKDELRIIESYLSLQKRRFGKRLVVTQTIDPALGTFIIPRLILQPIVENAVTHGLEKKKGAGHLAIQGSLVANLVVFTIRDNGVGMPPTIVRKINDRQALEPFESHGNGLQNVIDRIRLYYGDVCGVTIKSDDTSGTIVTITMQPKELL
jgi:two-component system, sensor histidine kinase YesM